MLNRAREKKTKYQQYKST